MKKLISIILAIMLVTALTVPVSAATTGAWNISAGQAHVQQTIQKMIQSQGYVFNWDFLNYSRGGK